jgi:hypothetical protein
MTTPIQVITPVERVTPHPKSDFLPQRHSSPPHPPHSSLGANGHISISQRWRGPLRTGRGIRKLRQMPAPPKPKGSVMQPQRGSPGPNMQFDPSLAPPGMLPQLHSQLPRLIPMRPTGSHPGANSGGPNLPSQEQLKAAQNNQIQQRQQNSAWRGAPLQSAQASIVSKNAMQSREENNLTGRVSRKEQHQQEATINREKYKGRGNIDTDFQNQMPNTPNLDVIATRSHLASIYKTRRYTPRTTSTSTSKVEKQRKALPKSKAVSHLTSVRISSISSLHVSYTISEDCTKSSPRHRHTASRTVPSRIRFHIQSRIARPPNLNIHIPQFIMWNALAWAVITNITNVAQITSMCHSCPYIQIA